ncbi:hypothetical protein [Streptosporangium sp. V21-05]|uniref:hypothetical protein n=1 Tax=Streptosporangium sp. V21-05 TaxID=3446115 RepID=UPI003F53705F
MPIPRPLWRSHLPRVGLVLATLAGMSLTGTSARAAAATFTNPLNSTGPDPWMTHHNGDYHLMSTPWNGPLTTRRAPTIAALKSAAPVAVFDDFVRSPVVRSDGRTLDGRVSSVRPRCSPAR